MVQLLPPRMHLGHTACEHKVVLITYVNQVPSYMVNSERRRVCFCFGYTDTDIVEDFCAHGHSTIQKSIRVACHQGLSDCERLNPQGHCCLGDVALLLKHSNRAVDASDECCDSAQKGALPLHNLPLRVDPDDD